VATPAPGASRRDGVSGGRGSLAQRFDAELSRRLREAARASDVTVGTLLLGAYAMLLAQETDRDDLLFVTTRAGRRSAPFDAREMVGMLMVSSPIRLRIAPDATVGEWLRQVRAWGQAVRDFEHVPLSHALAWSDIVRPPPDRRDDVLL
jgi:non-ribosomal peptide synthetase component F